MEHSRPLAIDLFTGLSGWGDGLIAEGWRVVGFDIEDMFANFGIAKPEHFQLVLQDVRTLHGSQFRDAALIVASPPCQEFSYMAMPWSRAKAKRAALLKDPEGRKRLTELFDTCFRIQREACESAGRHIPMVVENVRGANEWVGRSRWNFGSFHLWGDVPALMPIEAAIKNWGGSWFNIAHNTTSGCGQNPDGRKLPSNNSPRRWQDREVARLHDAWVKVPSLDWNVRGGGQAFNTITYTGARRTAIGNGERFTSLDCGVKQGGDWFNAEQPSISRIYSSRSPARARARAQIAKIPLPLARHIARVYKPEQFA
jgi:hypothetical protein